MSFYENLTSSGQVDRKTYKRMGGLKMMIIAIKEWTELLMWLTFLSINKPFFCRCKGAKVKPVKMNNNIKKINLSKILPSSSHPHHIQIAKIINVNW